MSINALNFCLFLNCFATSVSQLKIMILQPEPIKLLVFQTRCAKTVDSTVLTILWSGFQSSGADNSSIKYGESCLRRQHAALAALGGEMRDILSFWQGLRMEKIPGVFWLIGPATSSLRHTILPVDITFTRMQNPTDSSSHTPTPFTTQGPDYI